VDLIKCLKVTGDMAFTKRGTFLFTESGLPVPEVSRFLGISMAGKEVNTCAKK